MVDLIQQMYARSNRSMLKYKCSHGVLYVMNLNAGILLGATFSLFDVLGYSSKASWTKGSLPNDRYKSTYMSHSTNTPFLAFPPPTPSTSQTPRYPASLPHPLLHPFTHSHPPQRLPPCPGAPLRSPPPPSFPKSSPINHGKSFMESLCWWLMDGLGV